MFSQNPSTQDRVPGSKVRRADTGGQTHADERGFGKSICVTGEQVNLVSRNAIPPRADAAAKANGSPSSPRDSSVVRMEVGKENIALALKAFHEEHPTVALELRVTRHPFRLPVAGAAELMMLTA